VAGTAGWPIDFYLISCPYYSRPSQQGLALHFRALADRADGGILAAAHVETASFAEIGTSLAAGRRDAALALWQSLEGLTRLLFAEPSPAPIKHWLWRSGLIDSAEVRLPMMEASKELAARIDLEIERRKATSTGAASSAIRKLPADCDTVRAC
jgi:4-hydroxy-tetrahydrodipicolinate synthase